MKSRRRSNRPGNSQAKGPLAADDSGKQVGRVHLTDGDKAGAAAIGPKASGEISQVP
ncbi:hypothetical protein JCM17846_15460 [Iodidimonas nitroreducens]|uniref:Uncharacterized protein n=1 Tax=Iodidimonas nitroreducens TaxID=1236968 RepID=A0A5A7N7Y3_9PROT|nr:hypothetical protein JCM17846_15460 [Iodidimonas nitroreducens]